MNRKAILGAAAVGFVVVAVVAGTALGRNDAGARAIDPNDPVASVRAHFINASLKVTPMFHDLSKLASTGDLDDLGARAQDLKDWAAAEQAWLGASIFPDCMDSIKSDWRKVVAGFENAAQATIIGTDAGGDKMSFDLASYFMQEGSAGLDEIGANCPASTRAADSPW